MHAADLRPEITLGSIRPPQRLAPFSHAIGLEVGNEDNPDIVPTDAEGDAFGRLILLHDPGAEEAWEGAMRLVAYIQADMDDAVAGDPLLPDVAWQWLNEGLKRREPTTPIWAAPSLPPRPCVLRDWRASARLPDRNARFVDCRRPRPRTPRAGFCPGIGQRCRTTPEGVTELGR